MLRREEDSKHDNDIRYVLKKRNGNVELVIGVRRDGRPVLLERHLVKDSKDDGKNKKRTTVDDIHREILDYYSRILAESEIPTSKQGFMDGCKTFNVIININISDSFAGIKSKD